VRRACENLARRQGAARRIESEEGPEFLTAQARLTVERDGSLPGAPFERCLDDLLARQSSRENSALLVLRNEAPTMLLDFDSIRERATTLSHNDAGIAAYMQGVLGRKQFFSNQPNAHLGVILPWNIDLIMKSIDRHPGFPTQAESSGGLMEALPDSLQTWSLAVKLLPHRLEWRPVSPAWLKWRDATGMA
jgi:hypothetical protein